VNVAISPHSAADVAHELRIHLLHLEWFGLRKVRNHPVEFVKTLAR
jgi:hypothetical protein